MRGFDPTERGWKASKQDSTHSIQTSEHTARLSQAHSENKVSRDLRFFTVLLQNLAQLTVTLETSPSLIPGYNFVFAVLKIEFMTLDFLSKHSTMELS